MYPFDFSIKGTAGRVCSSLRLMKYQSEWLYCPPVYNYCVSPIWCIISSMLVLFLSRRCRWAFGTSQGCFCCFVWVWPGPYSLWLENMPSIAWFCHISAANRSSNTGFTPVRWAISL